MIDDSTKRRLVPAVQTAEQRGQLHMPRLIFFSELEIDTLTLLFERPDVKELIKQYGGDVALELRNFGPAWVELIRHLGDQGIGVIAWLQPEREGAWLNLQNYPQAMASYQRFRAWATEHDLTFAGVGLDIRPPLTQLQTLYEQGIASMLVRIWQARANALYPAARAAYRDLFAEMRLHGYQVHTFHLPALIDDRIAGTTLIQRTLNTVYLPVDVDVLLCYSVLPFTPEPLDTGGALTFAYGSYADAIAVGGAGSREATPLLTWPLLRRDLLLASQFTETIYIFSLEAVVERGLIPALRTLDWQAPAQPLASRRWLLVALRGMMISWLLLVRFAPFLFGWAGWIVAAVLLFQRIRGALRSRTPRHDRLRPPPNTPQ